MCLLSAHLKIPLVKMSSVSPGYLRYCIRKLWNSRANLFKKNILVFFCFLRRPPMSWSLECHWRSPNHDQFYHPLLPLFLSDEQSEEDANKHWNEPRLLVFPYQRQDHSRNPINIHPFVPHINIETSGTSEEVLRESGQLKKLGKSNIIRYFIIPMLL